MEIMSEKNSLPEPRVLVTGGARRIGAALVEGLNEAGMRTAIHYRDSREEAERLAKKLNQRRPGSASVHQGNLDDDTTPSRLIDEVVEHYDGLDILINNASSFYPTSIAETTSSHWENLLGTNLKAPYFLSQAAAPHLAKNHGVIINIADIHGIRPMPGYTVYSIAKAGLLMMTKALAQELGPRVRVNAIAPGAIIWPEDMDKSTQQSIINQTMLKRAGELDDIAKAVIFLIRDADYITRQDLNEDGGRKLHS